MLYPISDAAMKDIANRFSYHAPMGNQVERYAGIRDRALWFANHLLEVCPPSRERSTALSLLDEVVMFANASIARNEKPLSTTTSE